MKSVRLAAVGVVTAALVLALSLANDAWASRTAEPSPTTIYQTYLPTGSAMLGTSPTTILTSQVLPIGDYHVEAAMAVSVGSLGGEADDQTNVICNLHTNAAADVITANEGVAGNGSGYVDIDGSAVINGTITITQPSDNVSISCYVNVAGTGSFVSEVSLTAQPVSKIKT